MLAEMADHVIGVDTHRDSHSVAILSSRTGAVEAQTTVRADAGGYRRLLWFARSCAGGRRVWAIEGTGSYGAGLTVYLAEHGELVLEVERPRRREGTASQPKSDELDAIRAARHVLAAKHVSWPRRRDDREAIRVLLTTRESAVRSRVKAIQLLKGLIVSAPTGLRDKLRVLSTGEQLVKCSRLRTMPHHSDEHRAQ